MKAHQFVPTLVDGQCGEPSCYHPRDASIHIDAGGRAPLAHDAGDTQRASQRARSLGRKRQLIYDLIVRGARIGDYQCDHDLFVLSGLPWNESTAARNGLCIDGLIAPILTANGDRAGKRHPLKVGPKRTVVSTGPWRTKANPRGRGRVLVYAPTTGVYAAGWTP